MGAPPGQHATPEIRAPRSKRDLGGSPIAPGPASVHRCRGERRGAARQLRNARPHRTEVAWATPAHREGPEGARSRPRRCAPGEVAAEGASRRPLLGAPPGAPPRSPLRTRNPRVAKPRRALRSRRRPATPRRARMACARGPGSEWGCYVASWCSSRSGPSTRPMPRRATIRMRVLTRPAPLQSHESSPISAVRAPGCAALGANYPRQLIAWASRSAVARPGPRSARCRSGFGEVGRRLRATRLASPWALRASPRSRLLRLLQSRARSVRSPHTRRVPVRPWPVAGTVPSNVSIV